MELTKLDRENIIVLNRILLKGSNFYMNIPIPYFSGNWSIACNTESVAVSITSLWN